MKVLIAGCGDVGGVLASLLLGDGHTVYGLKRDTSSLPPGVIPVQADLLRRSSLEKLPDEVDCLVFMPTPGRRDQAAYESIFIQGWKNLVDSLKVKPKRSLLVSSTAVFGEDNGAVVTELSDPQPKGFNGKVLLEMETLALKQLSGVTVARVSGIYGPGRERLIRLAASEKLEVQQDPPAYTNRIHINDVAAALKHLMDIEQADELYLVTDDVSAPRYDVISWLAQVQGKPAPKAVTSDLAKQGKRVSNQRLKNSGFKLQYPDYRAGYAAILKNRPS